MNYLQTYEEFKRQKYTIGDIVKLKNGNIAKIVKINSKYSYIVNLMTNTIFSKKPIEVKEDEILNLVRSNSEPAVGTDITINPSTNVTNDLVINGGYPDVPIVNTLGI